MRNCRLKEVKCASHIDINKGLPRKADNVRLVQRTGMNDAVEIMLGKKAIYQSAIDNASNAVGRGTRNDVESEGLMPGFAQHGGKKPTKPS